MRLTHSDIQNLSTGASSRCAGAVSNLNGILSSIKNVTEDNELKGFTYYNIKVYWIENYAKIVNELISVYEDYKSAVMSVCDNLSTFLNGYAYLDTKELPTLRNKVSHLRRTISLLRSVEEPDYSYISQCERMLDETEELIRKLELVEPMNSQCLSKINQYDSKIIELDTKVSGLTSWNSSGLGYRNSYEVFLTMVYGEATDPEELDFITTNLAKKLEEQGKSINDINLEIYERIEEAGIGTRQGVVAAATGLIDIMAKYGIKLPYRMDRGEGKYLNAGLDEEWKRGKSKAGTDGLDCSGFVQWALLNGGYTVPSTLGTSTITEVFDDYKREFTEYEGIPGDLVLRRGSNSGHVGMIVDINIDENGNKVYKVAEAEDFDHGVLYNYYGVDNGEGWVKNGKECTIIDMEAFYDHSSPELEEYIRNNKHVNVYDDK